MVRQYHWWLSAVIDGKPQLVYGAPDFGSEGGESSAREKGLAMLQGFDFRMHRYPTRNLSEASAFHRGKRLESGEGLRAATQKLGHEKSIARRLERKRRLGL